MLKLNRKFALARSDGYYEVRVFHRSRAGKKDPRFLLKCGCCENKFEVYYGGDSLEIGGVMGSVENWREVLLPLLNMKLPGQEQRKRNASRRARTSRAAQTGKSLSQPTA